MLDPFIAPAMTTPRKEPESRGWKAMVPSDARLGLSERKR